MSSNYSYSSLLPTLNGKQHWHNTRSSYTRLSVRSRLWLWFSVGALMLLAGGYAIKANRVPPPPPPPPPAVARVRPDYFESVASNAKDKPRYAYATWISNTAEPEGTKPEDGYYHSDLYMKATRLLVWQLLHDPKTKTTNNIDVVVMVGPKVTQADKDRLTKDGAIVREVELVHGQNDAWITPMESRWADVMGKLRAWQMTEYDKVLMLDTDTILQSSLDSVFDDPGAKIHRTKPDNSPNVTSPRREDELDLPDEYLLSSYVEIMVDAHSFPPADPQDIKRPGYFNAGFFMLRPDQKLFEYFVGLLDLEGRFRRECPEQDLLNYAFRWEGPMPWREVDYHWNMRLTSPNDLKNGVVSVHEKFWKQYTGGNELKELICSKRWQMEGYYLGLEQGLNQSKSS